tara:strand:+ start:870 stop:1232 length:363 start_codon:yes stop_codon:yes gene_type:complete
MHIKIYLLITLFFVSCESKIKKKSKIGQINITGYDWCYPGCEEPISAFKFHSDGTFNSSTSMFGGMSRWGDWEFLDDNKIKLKTIRISTNTTNDKIPEPQIITIISDTKIQVGNTSFIRN